MDPPDSTLRTPSRSVQRLFQGSRSWQTDRQTDRPRYSVCNDKPHLRSTAMRPKKTQTSQNKCSAVAEMGDRLATIDLGRKLGGCSPLEGELGPHVTQCGLGRGLPACQVSPWSIQPFGHNTPTLQTGQTDRQRSDSIGRTVLQTVAQKNKPTVTCKHCSYWCVYTIKYRPVLIIFPRYLQTVITHSAHRRQWTHKSSANSRPSVLQWSSH